MDILGNVTNNIFSGHGGVSITEDLFGYQGATLTGYLDSIFNSSLPHSAVIKFFYQQLYRDFAPDINGYTMVFFIPPDLSGYISGLKTNSGTNFDGLPLYDQVNPSSYMNTVGKIMTFAAVDFTPPQSQIRTENVSTRSGSIPIASEVSESETCSITFIDNRFLDIYMFHHIWVEYIREILEGTVEPEPKYYSSNDDPVFYDPDYYGAIDYAASFYIVKYRPDMKTVTFVSKCVGIFPQSLPNKELIGSRTTNEIVTLPFTYSCSGYREALYSEQSAGMWLFNEIEALFLMYVQAGAVAPGGFLSGVLGKAIGPTSGALSNLTNNAAQLGGIVGNFQNSVVGATSRAWSTISGLAVDGYKKIIGPQTAPETPNYSGNIGFA